MGEGTICLEMPMEGVMAEENSPMGELKRERDYTGERDHFPNKKQAKEVSNDDIISEISNPIASPVESTSRFRDVSSQPAKSGSGDPVECGEVIGACSGSDFGSEETISDDASVAGSPPTDHSSDVLASRFVLEIPKHLSSTGITKITFKFSKQKKDFDDLPVIKDEAWDGVAASGWDAKMPKKIVSSSYPSNVKKLLATGILDGARVKYISTPPVVNSESLCFLVSMVSIFLCTFIFRWLMLFISLFQWPSERASGDNPFGWVFVWLYDLQFLESKFALCDRYGFLVSRIIYSV